MKMSSLMYQHDEETTLEEKNCVDLCKYNGKSNLISVTVDYFSKLIDVDVLTNISSKQVILCLKRHFARYTVFPVVCIQMVLNTLCV